MKGSANFSECRSYRYRLTRQLSGSRGVCLFIMLNPSTADAHLDDPTIGRCIGYATDWGYSKLEVVNLFAFRATSPDDMKASANPVGPRNEGYVKQAVKNADTVILAWGAKGVFLNQHKVVLNWIKDLCVPMCIALTKGGQPRHPLYLKRHLIPFKYIPREEN